MKYLHNSHINHFIFIFYFQGSVLGFVHSTSGYKDCYKEIKRLPEPLLR